MPTYRSLRPRLLRAAVCGAAAAALLDAGAADGPLAALGDLSLEQLGELRVVTVSRLEEPLERAAAAAYVIGADAIRRSGATTIAQALRLAPMLDVARADANQYAIGARGFVNVLANKMLVLIDGRTVYTPLFSGVFWEAQDLALADVERIEVVTGPSTALWGSNAVNGLIHVITRRASQTDGAAAAVSAGNRERSADARFGLRPGAAAVRLYAKAYERDATRRADGRSVGDRAAGAQAGFRGDWADAQTQVTVQGDLYDGRIDQGVAAATRRFGGANLLARWEHGSADGRSITLQAGIDHTRRDHPQVFRESLDTLDLVAQLALAPHGAHRVLVGAGLRDARDDVTPFPVLAFIPGERRLRWQRLFVQDQVQLGERVVLTGAASFERNPYTGWEWLPSARLAFAPDAGGLAWLGLARAVRAPSRIDRDFFQPGRPPFVVAGGPDFRSEVSYAAEAGWRSRAAPGLSWSAVAYRQEHERLRSLAPTPQGLQLRNDIEGFAQGIEAWMRWRVRPRWQLDGGLVVQRVKLRVRDGGVNVGGLAALGNDPRHWWSLRSALDLAPALAWDVALRRVGARPQPAVPAYTALDTRLAWRPRPDVEMALVLRNAADPQHAEWGTAANRAEIARSIALQLHWQH